MNECKKNSDENRLIREGTTQEERFPAALDPAYAPVDDWKIEHGILFAKAYAKFLKYYDAGNREAGDWQPFFSKDVSALLAVMTMQDVEACRENIKGYIKTLNDNLKTQIEKKESLGKTINSIGSLAKQIDILKEGLPDEYPLKTTLSNLVKNRLTADFQKLILCCKDCFGSDTSSLKRCTPAFKVVRSESHTDLITLLERYSFSNDWICPIKDEDATVSSDEKITWIEYLRRLYNPSVQIQSFNIEQISNNFLIVYARTITEARRAFEDSLTKWNRHEPHYALFLAFLRLMKHARNELNTLTGKHLDFYYREILQFKEKEVVPPKAHVLVELAKQVPSYFIKAGEEFKAGKDDLGKDVFFASERDFVANRAKVAALKTVYRHGDEVVVNEKNEEIKIHQGRLYASSFANSENSQDGELISEDKSWHPFFNKKYKNGKIAEIKMSKAEIGFAIASHYLWMAGGDRTVIISFNDTDISELNLKETDDRFICLFSGEKGWFETKKVYIYEKKDGKLLVGVRLTGNDPAIVPYSSKIHGDNYNFETDLPVLQVKLTHQDEKEYSYDIFNDLKLKKIHLKVKVDAFKPLVVSNDFGPIDTSKPFQPFGPSPAVGSSFVIGAKEPLQKEIRYIQANITWKNSIPIIYQDSSSEKILASIKYLYSGKWSKYKNIKNNEDKPVTTETEDASCNCCEDKECSNIINITYNKLYSNEIFLFGEYSTGEITSCIDFSAQQHIDPLSRDGFIKIEICQDFGQKKYEKDMLSCLQEETPESKSKCISAFLSDKQRPEGPFITELTINYETNLQEIIINFPEDTDPFQTSFFHVAPFGCAEQYLLNLDKSNKGVYLFPQIALPRQDENANEGTNKEEAAELYIGITDLKPPQNLSLLFQMADGTANPQVIKPTPQHIYWSYLRNNEWIPFLSNAVEDYTDQLITSGIITFAVPRDASDDNTLLPAGMHWIRAAVSSAPDAVCRLRMVEAQAVKIKFVDKENDPNFSAKTLLKDSITKLARPAAEVKKITQPFPSYGGRGKESSKAFYTRVSERLRHKDRAITLWDYERLILEAFPEMHKVKCLNHTCYDKGNIYDAPGHVTIVTIANQEHHRLPDPLRPNVSLGLQEKIKEFLRPKLSNFVKLHVVNPKFEEVRVDFRVKLHQGVDKTYFINTLKEAIVNFLSPWAFSGNGSPSFGGKIYKSALINFVEEQNYVDYLTDFQLFVDGGKDTETAEGSDAISILTSAHVSKHIIQITND